MSRHTRLSRIEAELQATVDRVMALTVERVRPEFTIPERRAFYTVATRILELRTAGVPCPLPLLPEQLEDVAGTVRLRASATIVATVEEWEAYYRVACRAEEVWQELGGPDLDARICD